MNKTLHRASLLSLAFASVFAWSSAQAVERNWSYTYNSLGLIETANGPRTDVSDVTTYAYDAQGSLTLVTNALSRVTQLQTWASTLERLDNLPDFSAAFSIFVQQHDRLC